MKRTTWISGPYGHMYRETLRGGLLEACPQNVDGTPDAGAAGFVCDWDEKDSAREVQEWFDITTEGRAADGIVFGTAIGIAIWVPVAFQFGWLT